MRNSSSSWFGSLDITLARWVIVHTFFLILICFISLLYLDLYVLGDDALIS